MIPYSPLPYALHFDICEVDNVTRATSKNINVSKQQSGNAYSAQNQCVQPPGFIFAILAFAFPFPPLDILPLFVLCQN